MARITRTDDIQQRRLLSAIFLLCGIFAPPITGHRHHEKSSSTVIANRTGTPVTCVTTAETDTDAHNNCENCVDEKPTAKCESCKDEFGVKEGKCIKCGDNCQTCYTKGDADAKKTDECSSCKAGVYALIEGKKCLDCTGCKACELDTAGTAYKCTECADDEYLKEGKCQKCGENKFSNCVACAPGTGSNDAKCTDCSTGHGLTDENVCEKCNEANKCAECKANKDKCTSCSTGHRLNTQDAVCEPCTKLKDCAECKDKKETCTKCNPGKGLKDGECTDCKEGCAKCHDNALECTDCDEKGFFLQGTKCEKCPTGCAKCTSSDDCGECSEGYKKSGSGKECTKSTAAETGNGSEGKPEKEKETSDSRKGVFIAPIVLCIGLVACFVHTRPEIFA